MLPNAAMQSPMLHESAALQNASGKNGLSQDGKLPASLSDPDASSPELREAFTDFVGQTLFGSMLSSMRKTVGKPAYMHGGRTEEVFQQQLDQHIVDDMTESSADRFSDPMFELFNMQRRA
ncbi:Rod binding protein [Rubripirellula obstinata]|uniref:Rod binding protein n=2 Tax=Rubripirellula obstinata TaxID=406547 RepID=A0A5B1CH30_9BACT|nr:Rod binding protein [Rubripirellula obstinata]